MSTDKVDQVDKDELWQTNVPQIRNIPIAQITQQNNISDIEEDDEIEETSADRVARMLNIVRDDSKAVIKVYRKPKPGFAMEWCGNYTPEEFENGGDLALIRDDWGPGLYQIRLYGVHPTKGNFCIRAREDIAIAIDLKAQKNAPTIHQQSEMSEMFKMMSDQNARILEALTKRPDPVEEMSRNIALLAQMKTAFAGNEQPKSSIGEVVAAIKELREVSDEINPKKEDDSSGGLIPLAAQVMEMVKTATEKQNAQIPLIHTPPVIAAAAIPNRNPISNTSSAVENVQSQKIENQQQISATQPNLETEEMTILTVINELKKQLNELLQMSIAGKTINDGAVYVFEVLPDEAIDLMEQENWFALLCQFEPACAAHEKWLREVRDLALPMFYEIVDEPESAPVKNELAKPAT